jgi:hypothetical protein
LLQAQAHQPWVTKSPVHLNLDLESLHLIKSL